MALFSERSEWYIASKNGTEVMNLTWKVVPKWSQFVENLVSGPLLKWGSWLLCRFSMRYTTRIVLKIAPFDPPWHFDLIYDPIEFMEWWFLINFTVDEKCEGLGKISLHSKATAPLKERLPYFEYKIDQDPKTKMMQLCKSDLKTDKRKMQEMLVSANEEDPAFFVKQF